jgi:UDPglucose 6-dehydrogenase
MREAPSLVVVRELARRGARLQAFDPAAMAQARRVLEDVPGVAYAADQNAALAGADALIILTEWREFRSPDFPVILSALKHALIFDGRNLFEPTTVRALGIEYHAIGRGVSVRGAAPATAGTA